MTAPPVLLLHGWGGSFHSSFAATGWPERLEAAGLRCIGLDLPGHGPKPASHDPSAYGDLAGGVLAQLPPGRIDVIAYSLGAKVALDIAMRSPTRIGRMVLIGVGDNSFAPERSAEAVVQALRHGVTDDTPEVARALVAYSRASRSDPFALAAVLQRPPNPVLDPARTLPSGPDVILINGDGDGIAQPDARLRAYLGRHRYSLLPGRGHFDLVGDRVVMETAVAAFAPSTAPAAGKR